MEQERKKSKSTRLILLAVAVLAVVFIMSGCVARAFTSRATDMSRTAPRGDYFAVIPIKGTIQETPESPMDSESYNHYALLEYIDRLIEDDRNKGILLEVNSGGGTVYQSDEMYLKLMEYKEKTGRPINAYFEDTAASGAYYISCARDKIIANRNCWTGSIGVIISYVNMSGLFEKLGLEEIIIASGSNKGMGSSARTLSDNQREIYQSLVDESYERFVGIVAESRGLDEEYVKVLADGRIYSAAQALNNGLVDEVRPLRDAVADMSRDTGAEPFYKYFDTSYSFIDYLLYNVKRTLPRGDMEALGRMVSSDLAGRPLYLYRE